MKTYCLVGTGYRGTWMYLKNLTEYYQDCARVIGVCDVNPKRASYSVSQMPYDIPVYTDFDKMLDELHPDEVIVTTIDRYHNEYCVRAMDKGYNVICEKPLTMQADKCREILDAERRTGKHVRVTFNLRFAPYQAKIKEVMQSGIIGEVLHVNMEWMLDTSHGADYFRRWHRYLENSGSLLVHKSTHHFDIVNWLIDQDPIAVYANGSLSYYGKDRKEDHGVRCTQCKYKDTCALAFPDAEAPDIKDLYFGTEDVDGYYRDRCLFDSSINIYDTMSLAVKYNRGALMTYSLIAYAPYEGWKLTITGTNGRLEAQVFDNGVLSQSPNNEIRVFTRDGDMLTYSVPKDTTAHGGGDRRMLNMLFRGIDHGRTDDPLHQCATTREGTMSIMIGICAAESIRTGSEIKVKDLVDTDYYFGDTPRYN